MQISILTLMLALGLPGANPCNAQQQGLPPVGQTPPVATSGEQTPVVTDSTDADEPEEMDADDELGEAGEMLELPEIAAGDELERLDGKLQQLTIQPGSTVILETKDGKQVVLRAQGPGGIGIGQAGEGRGLMAFRGLSGLAQAAPQNQDDRVRQLEQRVRELEAQLRERDDRAAPMAPKAFSLWAPKVRAEAEAERAQAQELRARMGDQARNLAAQARRQAEGVRKQGALMRKQALEQAEQWRVYAQGQPGPDILRWKLEPAPEGGAASTPAPDIFVEVQPGQPNTPAPPTPETAPTPGAVEVPESPPAAWWSTTPAPDAVRMKLFKALKAPKGAGMPRAAAPEHLQEMQQMLNDMRGQMDEMRAQMQTLREELQNAPRRELR